MAEIQVIGLGVYTEENDVDKQYKRLKNVLKEERKSIVLLEKDMRREDSRVRRSSIAIPPASSNGAIHITKLDT